MADVADRVPTTHGIRISRATTDAWLIAPPTSVTSAAETYMMADQLGSVVWATSTLSGSASVNDGSVTTCAMASTSLDYRAEGLIHRLDGHDDGDGMDSDRRGESLACLCQISPHSLT